MVCLINDFGLRQFQWLGFGSAGELLTGSQQDLGPHYPAISELVLFTAFVVGDDKMNMVENICCTFLTQKVLYAEREREREREFTISQTCHCTLFM